MLLTAKDEEFTLTGHSEEKRTKEKAERRRRRRVVKEFPKASSKVR